MVSHSSRLPFRSTTFLAATALALLPSFACAQENNDAPKGFTAVFNGHDFDGWSGGGDRDPREIAALTGEPRDEWTNKMKTGIKEHWHVDKGELVSDGKGPFLATPREYGDIEMWVDWKIGKNGDSGIYLRG